MVEDYQAMGFSEEQAEKLNLERFKEHTRKLTKMEEDRPKLYGLMMKHMSVESKDEVAQDPDYEVWHADKDLEKLWKAIIRTHKVDCISNVTAVKELVARKAYQNIKQGSFESLAQYSERFRETYPGYKATGLQSRPVDIPEHEQALDFFHGLDQARYAAFKTSMLNGWATKAFDPPQMVNDIYRIAGAWVKPTSKPDGSTAATFVTTEEDAKLKGKAAKKAKEEKKKQAQQLTSAAAMATAGDKEKGKSSENGEKIPKDLSHIECFRCGEFGHYSTSKHMGHMGRCGRSIPDDTRGRTRVSIHDEGTLTFRSVTRQSSEYQHRTSKAAQECKRQQTSDQSERCWGCTADCR
jgi:hypothetical protein